MALTLYYHPLSSFCWKTLIALYEADIAFTPRLVNLGDPEDRAAFQKVWPMAKFPVLVDDDRSEMIPESSLIVEYLARRFPNAAGLVPADPDAARPVLLKDRLFDSYIHHPFQGIVNERMRPDHKDPYGVEQAKAAVARGYDVVAPMIAGPWAMGETFTLADCAALPALYYADPTRRAMVERLTRGPASVSELAAPFEMSLPAVVQHLAVLEASGLVASQKVGRVRTCRLDPGALSLAETWFNQRRTEWEQRFDRLGDYLKKYPDGDPK